MKITKASLTYTLLCNLPVSFMLTLTASLVFTIDIDWTAFGLNFVIGYSVATLVGLFVPLVDIGKKFTARFRGVKYDTYTNNIRYRLLAVFAITAVFFVFVSPTLAVFNYFYSGTQTVMDAFMGWLKMALPLITVGYAASLPSDYVAYHIANKIDPSF